MKKENIAGFTLVLSLVLLLVMSLMGGALVVISSSDHKSNNDSDLYQQTFYVAETGLIEGEKELINSYMGNWQEGSKTVTTTVTDPDTGDETEVTETIGTYTRSQQVMGDWKPPSNEYKADPKGCKGTTKSDNACYGGPTKRIIGIDCMPVLWYNILESEFSLRDKGGNASPNGTVGQYLKANKDNIWIDISLP